jgi:IclR family acetate operon transcriptional repressor
MNDSEAQTVSGPRNNSSSLRRALRLLDYVAENGPGDAITLSRAAADLGLSASTVLRLAAPLIDERLLSRDPATGTFRLGDGVLRLGQQFLEGLDLRQVAAPYLRALLKIVGETCHLVIPDGLEVVYIDKVEAFSSVRMASRIGRRMPMQSTAVGKAIIAASGPELLRDVLESGLQPVTERSITEKDMFIAEIKGSRQRGYAIDDRQNEPEVRCVASVIFNHSEEVVGAISVSALSSRMSVRRVREVGPLVRRAGLQISTAMGSRTRTKSLPNATEAKY